MRCVCPCDLIKPSHVRKAVCVDEVVEAMTLADRIVLMRDGHIVQVGTPLELFNAPVDTFVATFIGSPPMNLIDGQVQGDQVHLPGGIAVPVPVSAQGLVSDGQKVKFGFRADNLMPLGHSVEDQGAAADLTLPVTLTEPLGTETLLFAELGGVEVQAKMFNPRPVNPGEALPFRLMLDKCHLFDARSGAATPSSSMRRMSTRSIFISASAACSAGSTDRRPIMQIFSVGTGAFTGGNMSNPSRPI